MLNSLCGSNSLADRRGDAGLARPPPHELAPRRRDLPRPGPRQWPLASRLLRSGLALGDPRAANADERPGDRDSLVEEPPLPPDPAHGGPRTGPPRGVFQ